MQETLRAVQEAQSRPMDTQQIVAEKMDALLRANRALQDSEERYRTLVETTSDCLWEVNTNGNYTYVSPKIRDQLGYEPEEVIGKTPFDFMPTEEAHRVGELFAEIVKFRKSFKDLENINIHKDGRRVLIETSGMPILDEKGNLLSYRGIDRDITERKEMEEALKNSEKRFRQLADSTMEGIFIYDETGAVRDVNQAMLGMSGYRYEELIGRDIMGFVTTESREIVLKHMRSHYEGPLEMLMRKKDGSPITVEVHGRPILYEGKQARVVAIRDITERRRVEEALRKSEAMYSMITENMTDTIWLMDMDLQTTWISPSLERTRGYSLEEIRSVPLERHLTPESLKVVFEVAARELTPERLREKDLDISNRLELEFYRKDGSSFWSEVKFSLIRNPEGNPVGLLGVGRDISARKKAEVALRHSEERFSKAFHISPAPTIINAFDDSRYVDVNGSFLRLLGYTREEMIGRAETELHLWENQGDYRRCIRKLGERGFIRGELLRLRAKTGEIREVLVSAEIITLEEQKFILSICYDITEQRRLESQLRRSQKMEAVGTLAGGIAHDFNNILSAVIGYTEIALREADLSVRLRRYLDQIHQAGERAKHLVQQILTFSHQAEEKPLPMRVSLIIKEVLQLLRASLPSTIRIHQDIQSDPDTVLADPTQIHQIMMNLCTNAAHAIGESQGELKVALAPVEVKAHDTLALHDGLSPGMYLKLTVGDTGVGIEPEVIERIFDPFFTTKQPGVGTGMGLAVVHGIVKSCNGVITVKSEMGIGTEFNVYFPLLSEGTEGQSTGEARDRIVGGTERILFVDDEEVLVEVGKEMLIGLGYEVVGRTSSLEALELFRSRPDRFDLVITDMTMPNMTGIELFREIRHIRPTIPVILCSGFSESITREKAQAFGLNEFIMKPMVFPQIAPAIRRVLAVAGTP